MLPPVFETRMKTILGEEYEDFAGSFEEPAITSLRINPLKQDTERDLLSALKQEFDLTPVPWTREGYYYPSQKTPGKHVLHEAGAYYIQEASAMAPAAYLNAQPGERILDLCAAPGGKSTQIAAAMQGQGILVCNEIHPARSTILSENIERMGIANAIVTNEAPDHLAELFQEYFDRILVDAPCSGEGMFRKHPKAMEEWSPENVALCASRQIEILESAAAMLVPGGRLVYSTCTFAPEENEGTILHFLSRHPEFSICMVEKYDQMSPGDFSYLRQIAAEDAGKLEQELTKEQIQSIAGTIRLFPHRLHGEGHYLAVLQKEGNPDQAMRYSKYGLEKGLLEKDRKELREYEEFCVNTLSAEALPKDATLIRFKEDLYLAPAGLFSLKNLKVRRVGIHMGTLKKGRFEPGHALAKALKAAQVLRTADLLIGDRQAGQYLNGQTFSWEGEKGWYLITAEGIGLGWGKLAGGMMKNHYPKGLRMMYIL